MTEIFLALHYCSQECGFFFVSGIYDLKMDVHQEFSDWKKIHKLGCIFTAHRDILMLSIETSFGWDWKSCISMSCDQVQLSSMCSIQTSIDLSTGMMQVWAPNMNHCLAIPLQGDQCSSTSDLMLCSNRYFFWSVSEHTFLHECMLDSSMSMHEYCGLSEFRLGLASRNLFEICHSEICEISQLSIVVVVIVVQS